jgi:phosphate transport system protein
MATNPKGTFHRELEKLQDQVLILGSLVGDALVSSVTFLKKRDFDGSKRLIERDQRINEKRFDIEQQTLALIALHQPVARDLRTLGAILEVVTELERIGDYAKGIGKINLLIGEDPLIKPLVDLPLMADKAYAMLHHALQAFVNRDPDAARAIPEEDDEVDGLYNQVYRELLTYILSEPRSIEQANYLLWAAHNLERAADRTINICERVVFTVTGDMRELA